MSRNTAPRISPRNRGRARPPELPHARIFPLFLKRFAAELPPRYGNRLRGKAPRRSHRQRRGPRHMVAVLEINNLGEYTGNHAAHMKTPKHAKVMLGGGRWVDRGQHLENDFASQSIRAGAEQAQRHHETRATRATPVCSALPGIADDITCPATVQWSNKSQEWQLANTFDLPARSDGHVAASRLTGPDQRTNIPLRRSAACARDRLSPVRVLCRAPATQAVEANPTASSAAAPPWGIPSPHLTGERRGLPRIEIEQTRNGTE